jgi:hypothetical protein
MNFIRAHSSGMVWAFLNCFSSNAIKFENGTAQNANFLNSPIAVYNVQLDSNGLSSAGHQLAKEVQI